MHIRPARSRFCAQHSLAPRSVAGLSTPSLGARSRVLVIGGSEEYAGAPYLAGIAALRTGAESVIVMAPEKVAWAINALSPDLMTRKLKGRYLTKAHERTIREQMETADILVLGNGAGTRKGTASLFRSLMSSPLPKVVDADALKVLQENRVSNAILTPNEGEWELLAKYNDVKKLAAMNVIIQKGSPTKIWTRRVHISVRPNKGLNKAGTGDILAGMCAGYLAQGLSPLAAAEKACRTGNAIANILTKKKRGYPGRTGHFLASDLARELEYLSSGKV